MKKGKVRSAWWERLGPDSYRLHFVYERRYAGEGGRKVYLIPSSSISTLAGAKRFALRHGIPGPEEEETT